MSDSKPFLKDIKQRIFGNEDETGCFYRALPEKILGECNKVVRKLKKE